MDNHSHSGLRDLFSYPFVSRVAERRIARGAPIGARPLSHACKNKPSPLSKLEEAVPIVCTCAPMREP